MTRNEWELLLTDNPKGAVPRDGQQLRLLTALLWEMHKVSPTCLDRLEQLYTVVERLGLKREQLRFALEAAGDANHALKQPRYVPFWQTLSLWLEGIGINDIRIVDLGLSLVTSPHLQAATRSIPLREALLGNFPHLHREVIIDGAQMHDDIPPPQLPPYFPLAMDGAQYVAICQPILLKYAHHVERIYLERDAVAVAQVKKERFHIRLMAQYLSRRVSMRKLASLLENDPSFSESRGMSFNNISVSLSKLASRTGVQLPDYSEN